MMDSVPDYISTLKAPNPKNQLWQVSQNSWDNLPIEKVLFVGLQFSDS